MNNNDTDDNNRSLELELNFEHSCICINSLSHPARSARKQKKINTGFYVHWNNSNGIVGS